MEPKYYCWNKRWACGFRKAAGSSRLDIRLGTQEDPCVWGVIFTVTQLSKINSLRKNQTYNAG